MNEHLLKGIVRIVLPDGRVNGPGYFVSREGHILTCYHTIRPVINAGKVPVIFYNGAREVKEDAVILSQAEAHGEDIALLKIEFLPEVRFNLVSDIDFPQMSFSTYGYPENMLGGMYGYGITGNRTAKGWMQLSSKEVRSGFSGGPVVIGNTNDSVGIIKNQYNDYAEIVAHFCIPSEAVLVHFPELKPQHQIYKPYELSKYKCLVVHHEDRVEDFETLRMRCKRNKDFQENIAFQSFYHLFEQGFQEEKFQAALEQSNCLMLWISGDDFFYKTWDEIKELLKNNPALAQKEVLLVNVAEKENDFFEEQYRSFFNSTICYPADDPGLFNLPKIFPRINTFQDILLPHEPDKGPPFDHFLDFFYNRIVLFKAELAKLLREFDFDDQKTIMKAFLINNPESKFVILQLNGSEQCGLEVLANLLKKILDPLSPLIKTIDFAELNIHDLDDLLGFLHQHSGKLESVAFNDWQQEIYKNNGDVFYIFQNLVLPEFSHKKTQRHIALVNALVQKLEKIPPPENWEGRVFFLLFNKAEVELQLTAEKCQIINLPPVTEMNTFLINRWQENTLSQLTPSQAHHLKGNMPDTNYVGTFIMDICKLFNAEHLYYQQLAKL